MGTHPIGDDQTPLTSRLPPRNRTPKAWLRTPACSVRERRLVWDSNPRLRFCGPDLHPATNQDYFTRCERTKSAKAAERSDLLPTASTVATTHEAIRSPSTMFITLLHLSTTAEG